MSRLLSLWHSVRIAFCFVRGKEYWYIELEQYDSRSGDETITISTYSWFLSRMC